ncbi:signal peptidase I [Xylanimonas protaetiae]|uniref:signal peptidase I n=1 Tax=Xylanimonas protaetiae TaxID=2509457 RepID=UPI001F5C0FFB|nr:signal peptidase I [Xylanimonas protaetiae]
MTHPQPGPEPTPTDARPAPAGRPGSRETRRRRGVGASLLRETAVIVVSALALSWLIKTLLVQAFLIPSGSMHDTLVEGDRVMVSRLVPRVFDLHRGDIVVFKDPDHWLRGYVTPDRGPLGDAMVTALTAVGLMPQDSGEHLIKRVIGLPGDHVSSEGGPGAKVLVNGVPITETAYIEPGSMPSEVPFDVVVPDGKLWVMGDNRQDSADSRAHQGTPGGGFVPVDDVVGTAFATVWPLTRMTWHSNPGDVFAQVPAP